MLADWLAPESASSFLATQLGQAPFSRPGAAQQSAALLSWDTLERILKSQDPATLDLLTVSRGRLVDAPAPRSAADVRSLMRADVSVVLRFSERHDEGLRALADSLGQLVPGEIHVQLYATPSGSNSYGWHYDFEDVFIVQSLGVKDYYFRQNTVARQTALGQPLDFSVVQRETSPLMTARLLPGDWLHIPSRWWHLVTCAQDALSISIGVLSANAIRGAHRIPPGWSGTEPHRADRERRMP